MQLTILCFRNTELDCFTTPVFDDHAGEDAAVQLARGIKQACLKGESDKFKAYHNMEMYKIGEFDDVTGKLIGLDVPVKLLDCEKCFVSKDNENEK